MPPADPIGLDEFRSRLPELLLQGGAHGLPRKERDRLIILKALALGLDPSSPYSEKQLNAALRSRISQLGGLAGTDHVTLRRLLVDEHFLDRDAQGSVYRLRTGTPSFDPAVTQIDVPRLLEDTRQEAARRKRDRKEANR
jgi:hypothetical protein